MALTAKQIYTIVNEVASQAMGSKALAVVDNAGLVALGNTVLGSNETKNNFKMSWYFIKKQKKIIIPMLILSIILSLIGVLTPILSAKLLLNLSNKALDKLLNIALFIFLVEATRNIISFIFSLISEKCMTKIITEVRLEMLRETFKIETSETDKNNTGIFMELGECRLHLETLLLGISCKIRTHI